jgi:CarD family transcriptional regulator
MRFEGKSAGPDFTPEASDFVRRHCGSYENEKRRGFEEKDFIVYPAHGVGQILSIEEQIVAGSNLEFFVVYFAKVKLTVRVPTSKATNLGMRRPSDPALIPHVKRILTESPRRGRGTRSRLALEYESKINSGDITAIAEVVRDLYRPGVGYSAQSFSERQLYGTALDRLSDEVALVETISKEQSVEKLEDLLKEGTLKRVR